MNLNGPRKVADVDKERNVGVVAEIKVFVGEAVFELLDVAPGDDGDLLAGLGPCWMRQRQREREACTHRDGGRDSDGQMEGVRGEKKEKSRRGGQMWRDRQMDEVKEIRHSKH